MTPRRARFYLGCLLAAYLALALGYGLVNPIFEAPDEQHHYFTAQTIAQTWRLPTISLGDDYNRLMGQEAAQPPLYYLLCALLIAPIDVAGAENQLWFNPFVRLGDASSPANINAFIQTPAWDWPWSGMAFAVHLLRAFSALLGIGTLLCIYASARLLWSASPHPALLAVAAVAFLPQFGFHHGAVTNDVLITLTASAAIYQLLRLWLDKITVARLFWLGLTIAAAVLSKTAGILLLLYALGFLLLLAWRDQNPRLGLLSVAIIGGVTLLLSGWLLWRNWQLYGDPTAANQFIRLAGGDRHYTVRQALVESRKIWDSLFAVFGWFNVRAPGWLYGIWRGLAALAALGGLLAIVRQQPFARSWRRSRLFLWALLLLWPLLVYLGMFQFMLKTPAAQGRLLFPALLPLSLLLAAGWSQLLAVGWSQQPAFSRWGWLLPALAAVTTLYSVAVVIPQAYAPMPIVAELPAAARLEADLGQNIILVAASVDTPAAHPGDWVWLDLYWRATAPPPVTAAHPAPEYVINLIGRDFKPVGKLQSYHGAGRQPAVFWPLGPTLYERVPVRLDDNAATPTQVTVHVSLVGESTNVAIGALKLTPPQWRVPFSPPLAQFGDGIQLAQADVTPTAAAPGDAIALTVIWQVVAPPGRDLTTFFHLGDPAQPPLAQGDAPPHDYPTHFWTAGERIPDQYTLQLPHDLPPGNYPLQMGLYDPATGERLPLTVNGAPQPHNAFPLGWLEVLP
ncbi:MAG: hypothetical protein Fur0021_03650 [Candidatus Promineifilaceae bacterium]